MDVVAQDAHRSILNLIAGSNVGAQSWYLSFLFLELKRLPWRKLDGQLGTLASDSSECHYSCERYVFCEPPLAELANNVQALGLGKWIALTRKANAVTSIARWRKLSIHSHAPSSSQLDMYLACVFASTRTQTRSAECTGRRTESDTSERKEKLWFRINSEDLWCHLGVSLGYKDGISWIEKCPEKVIVNTDVILKYTDTEIRRLSNSCIILDSKTIMS